MSSNTKNKLNEEDAFKNKKINENILISKPTRKKRKKKNQPKIQFQNSIEKSDSNTNIKSLINTVTKQEKEKNGNDNKVISDEEINENNIEKKPTNKGRRESLKEPEIGKRRNSQLRRIIKKVKLNKACLYLCFCCVRKRKNVENALIDEGMKINTEKLDLMNLFKILYKEEILHAYMDQKFEVIEMSEECKLKLQNL